MRIREGRFGILGRMKRSEVLDIMTGKRKERRRTLEDALVIKRFVSPTLSEPM